MADGDNRSPFLVSPPCRAESGDDVGGAALGGSAFRDVAATAAFVAPTASNLLHLLRLRAAHSSADVMSRRHASRSTTALGLGEGEGGAPPGCTSAFASIVRRRASSGARKVGNCMPAP
ncbi:MAG: hypothetical protein QM820_04485 [Minicystis sp.]